jgi:catechol 2,3-dioxygenase-like lactoylglutathione lyase family enzyme
MFKTVIPKLPARDVKKAVAFYEQRLGFRAIFDYEGYAAVERDGLEIHLWECHDPTIAENTAFRLGVEDIEMLYDEFLGSGVIHPNGALEEKPWGGREFVILDLDGNGIFIFEEE